MARHFGMALAPWDVLGGGRLQSKRQMEERKSKGEGLRTMGAGSEQTEEEVKFSQVLSDIAEKRGLESPTTIALAYVLNKAPFVFPIIGGRKVEVSWSCSASSDSPFDADRSECARSISTRTSRRCQSS